MFQRVICEGVISRQMIKTCVADIIKYGERGHESFLNPADVESLLLSKLYRHKETSTPYSVGLFETV